MKLSLYSSRRGNTAPHLVAIQSEELDMLATVPVCPLRDDVPLTRVTVSGKDFVVMCEPARPIHRRALQRVGELSQEDSALVMMIFGLLLGRR